MKNKKINWRVYERDHLYPQSISAYLDLINLAPSKKHPYIANYYEVMSYCKDYFWWARDADLLEKAAQHWINNWIRNRRSLRKLINLHKKSYHKITNILPKLKKIDPSTINNIQLYNLYRRVKNIFLKNIIFSEYTTDLFDDFFGKIFTEYLQKLSDNKINKIDFDILIRPARHPQILLYKKRVLELSFYKNISQNILKDTAEKFNWIMMGWDGSSQLTENHLFQEIKKAKTKKSIVRRKEISEIKNFLNLIKRKRLELTKKYKLSFKKLEPYFYLLDTFILFHDWRKEAQMRCNQIIFPVLQEMNRRFGVTYQDLLRYFPEEIQTLCLFGRQISSHMIKKRREGITFVIRKGKIRQFFGRKAKEILEKLVLKVIKAKQTLEVFGITANKGKVRGRARVVKSAKEVCRLIKKGEILITSMTTIDYLPAIHHAAAIVTDDGGITCHAAIVSRELNKPCVVGTKISTQVFKTGDLVEVDANKGIVRKIK